MQDSATRTVPNGACGYGDLSAEMYPGFLLAGEGLHLVPAVICFAAGWISCVNHQVKQAMAAA